MDENNIPGENEEVKKEPTPPTVEALPDLNETEPEETAPEAVPSPAVKVELKKENAPRAQVVQKRGVPTGVFVTVLILAVIATFMVTYVCLFNSFQEKFDQIRLMYAGSAEGNLASLNGKMSAIDGEIRAGYLYDIDEEGEDVPLGYPGWRAEGLSLGYRRQIRRVLQ